MSKSFDENVHVTEGIFVGNWLWGNIVVTPQANEVTLVDVTGLNIAGQGELNPQASVKSAYPWSSAGHVTVASLEDGTQPWEAADQIRIAFRRVNDSETRIHWMVWRQP